MKYSLTIIMIPLAQPGGFLFRAYTVIAEIDTNIA